jgi:hypothetical protein
VLIKLCVMAFVCFVSVPLYSFLLMYIFSLCLFEFVYFLFYFL